MDTLLHLTFLYLILLLLALLVERIMELLHAAFNYLEWQFNAERRWNRRAERLIERLDSKAKSTILSHALILSDLGRVARHYAPPGGGMRAGNVIVISGDAVRRVAVRTISRIVASAVGVALCVASGLNLFTVLTVALGDTVTAIPFFAAIQHPLLQLGLTGILIGLGAEPVHHMIRAIERRRAWNAERDRLNNALIDANRKPV